MIRELTVSEVEDVSGGAFWVPLAVGVAGGIALYEYTKLREGSC